jgi:hypothetical protein
MVKTLAVRDVKKDFKFSKLISKERDVIIRPTKGLRTIAKADNIFHAGIDSDFVKYKTNVGSKATNKMEVQIFEQIHDGKLVQLFADFGKPMDDLCMTQDQIISFIEGHDKLLSTNGWGTLFLSKVQSWHCVAAVGRNEKGIYVYMFRLFHGGHTLLAKDEHRIVIPQM